MESLHAIYPSLYGSEYSASAMDSRFASLITKHQEFFGEKEAEIFSAAGRTEIAGNHTDHNLGKVIGGTINLDTVGAVSRRDDNTVIIASEGFPVCSVDISDLDVHEDEKNRTEALIRGIARSFRDRGIAISGWQANTETNVLKGSGLSSSAAIEVLTAEIFNSLFSAELPPIELAKIGKYAENVYFGKPSGLLDQACCAQGGISAIDFRDTDNPVLTPIEADFADYGYVMIITDTKGNHADLTPEYAAIPPEMRLIAKHYGKENLREVNPDRFFSEIRILREIIGNDRAILRAIHFFEENERVDIMAASLINKDINTFLSNVRASGESSFKYLQNVYPSSSPSEQGLSIALAYAERILGSRGVSRVHGGGFAGTIQSYVPIDYAPLFISSMESIFGKGCSSRIAIRKLPVARIL